MLGLSFFSPPYLWLGVACLTVSGPTVLPPSTISKVYVFSVDSFGELPPSVHDTVKPVASNVPPAAGAVNSTSARAEGARVPRRGRMAKGRRNMVGEGVPWLWAARRCWL